MHVGSAASLVTYSISARRPGENISKFASAGSFSLNLLSLLGNPNKCVKKFIGK